MTGALLLALLLAPAAPREPVGGAERPDDPLACRVSSLLAGEPVTIGIASIVPLYARVPSEAGHGRPSELTWASGLRARLLVDDGRMYLRVVNAAKGPVLLAAGTVFSGGGLEVAASRDAVIPVDYAALVPAAQLVGDGDADLSLAGALPPLAAGALVAGVPGFPAAVQSFALRGEDRYSAVLGSAAVRSRRDGLAALLRPLVGGFGGTMVGVVLVVGDRPVAARVFARHDLFVEALPDILLGFAVSVREVEAGPADAGHIAPAETRSRAIGWLRSVARTRGTWAESFGAGFETVFTCSAPAAAVHGVADQQRSLVHAAFYAIQALPEVQGGQGGPSSPPTPPDNPDESPTGFRERRPRPTVEDERRSGQNPNPGPHGDPKSGSGGGQAPDRGTPPR